MPYIGSVPADPTPISRRLRQLLQAVGLLLLWPLSDLAARLLLQRQEPQYFSGKSFFRPLPTADGEPIVLFIASAFILLLGVVLIWGGSTNVSAIPGLPYDSPPDSVRSESNAVTFQLPPQASQLTIGLLLTLGLYAVMVFGQDLYPLILEAEPAWLPDYLHYADISGRVAVSPFFSQTAGSPSAGFSLPTSQLAAGDTRYSWLLLAYVVSAPAAEELLLRGLVVPKLKLIMRPGRAVVLSSLLFALLYPEPQQFLLLLLLGLIWGWAAETSGTLLPNLISRPLVNLFLLLPPSWFVGWPQLRHLLTSILVIAFIMAVFWLVRNALGPMARTHTEPLGSRSKAANTARTSVKKKQRSD